MEIAKILAACDHTLLNQTATWEGVEQLCEEAKEFKTASVCIPPCYVRMTKMRFADTINVCTVIGFPNGNMTTAAKLFEVEDAVKNGADEIDMVINIGMLKAKNLKYICDEIRAVKDVCGTHVLKVIVETCLLTEEEKIEMCRIVTEANADYIKTSTGFSKAGATFDDVRLFARNVGTGVKIKAAGGISTLEDAAEFIELGASRLGTSRIVKIVKEMKRRGELVY